MSKHEKNSIIPMKEDYIKDDNNNNSIISDYLIKEIFDLKDDVKMIIDELIKIIIKIQDKIGYEINIMRQIINKNISLIKQPISNNIYDWLIENQSSSQYIFFLGFLYYNILL
ncbi:unnamed protein product [Rhizophagus irregularis]|nr:unnamed protein product [Rhizophagus irregularis]